KTRFVFSSSVPAGGGGDGRVAVWDAVGRWSALAASALIQLGGGSYCFGVYSPAIKASQGQGYDQSALDAVAFFDVGANAGVLSGFLSA
uniref:Nodulin-like domain-containing protein n=4 Tax=Aegilops tauschii subsp. strangulata TaxID=200361 RepID=A0A453T649_AEGTS